MGTFGPGEVVLSPQPRRRGEFAGQDAEHLVEFGTALLRVADVLVRMESFEQAHRLELGEVEVWTTAPFAGMRAPASNLIGKFPKAGVDRVRPHGRQPGMPTIAVDAVVADLAKASGDRLVDHVAAFVVVLAQLVEL